jgi:hypothetical protein
MNHKFDSIHNTSFLYITSLIRFKKIPFASQKNKKKTNRSAVHRAGGRTRGGGRAPPGTTVSRAPRLLQDERDMRWGMEKKIREKKIEKMSGHMSRRALKKR